jgi:hypothetical protein
MDQDSKYYAYLCIYPEYDEKIITGDKIISESGNAI